MHIHKDRVIEKITRQREKEKERTRERMPEREREREREREKETHTHTHARANSIRPPFHSNQTARAPAVSLLIAPATDTHNGDLIK